MRTALVGTLVVSLVALGAPVPVMTSAGLRVDAETPVALANLVPYAVPAFPQTDGPVYASVLAPDGTLYIGGLFNKIGGLTRSNLAAIDTATGFVKDWKPYTNAPVRALAVSGSTIYVGGDFTQAGGPSWWVTRNYLAAFDTATGALKAWNPDANSVVHALTVSGTTLYAGGQFFSIGGSGRSHLAAFDAASGAIEPWSPPVVYGVVNTVAVSGATIYAGGEFTRVGGATRGQLAAFDAATGALKPWNPSASGGGVGGVNALAVTGSTAYVGSDDQYLGGHSRSYLGAVDASTATLRAWNPSADGPVHALAVSGSTVYLGGQFTSVGNVARNHIAAVDAVTGGLKAWNPDVLGDVSALAVSGSTVYAGGLFTKVGGLDRTYLAAIKWPVSDISGGTRYDTAIAASKANFIGDGSCGSVVLATGRDYPDALAAAALAGAAQCPILLVDGAAGSVAPKVIAEMSRLTKNHASRTVYLCGGTGAVSAGIESLTVRASNLIPSRWTASKSSSFTDPTLEE